MLEPRDRIGTRFDFGDFVKSEKESAPGGHDRRRLYQAPKPRKAAGRPLAAGRDETPPPYILGFARLLGAEFEPGATLTIDQIAAALDMHRSTTKTYTATLARHGLLPYTILHVRRGRANEIRPEPVGSGASLSETDRSIRDYRRSNWARPTGAFRPVGVGRLKRVTFKGGAN